MSRRSYNSKAPRHAHLLKVLRRAAFDRQGGLCYWCEQPMELEGRWNSPHLCTADHLRRRASGGGTVRNNIVAACRDCNNRRHEDAPPLDLKNERIA